MSVSSAAAAPFSQIDIFARLLDFAFPRRCRFRTTINYYALPAAAASLHHRKTENISQLSYFQATTLIALLSVNLFAFFGSFGSYVPPPPSRPSNPRSSKHRKREGEREREKKTRKRENVKRCCYTELESSRTVFPADKLFLFLTFVNYNLYNDY